MPIEIPPREYPSDDKAYFEQLTKSIFRSGFSWKIIREKWPHFVQAFHGFDLQRVAAYGEQDLERLLNDTGIVRNGRKIEATISNAKVMLELIDSYGSFKAYLQSFRNLGYAARRDALTKCFFHLGPTGAFVFLYTVGEPVPAWDERNR